MEYFYHEAFDIDFKAVHEGGARWGIFDSAGNLKPGMEQVLRGARSDTLMQPVPGGVGSSPSIEIDEPDARGSAVKLRGRVLHVDPAPVAVHIFMRVDGRGWPKPTYAQSFVLANPDGFWEAGLFNDGHRRHCSYHSFEITTFSGVMSCAEGSL